LDDNDSAINDFAILDLLPTGAIVLGNDYIVFFWNSRLEEWTGINRESIVGSNILNKFPPLKEDRFYQRLEDVLGGGLPVIFSSKLHKYFIPSPLPGGQMRQQQTTVMPLDISESDGRYALVIIEDVTDLTKTIGNFRAMRDKALEEIEIRKETEERFRTAFNTNPDPTTIERLSDNIIIDANDSFFTVTGFNREEVIGKSMEDLNFLVQPFSKNQLLDELNKCEVIVNRELQIRRKDSTIRTALTSLCLLNIAGEPHALTISKDITELRETQKKLQTSLGEKEVLLKEIHHRVKNNMLTISALLSLQAAEAKDERITKMVAESMNRIQAMAMIHETLYSTESLAEIELGEYLAKLCEKIQSALVFDRKKILLTTESDEIKLSPDQAIPCALAVNELVSNSVEHAFPSNRSGTITVESSLLEGKKVKLTVSDNGVGIANNEDLKENGPFLGLKLVKSLVVEQLNGSFEVTRQTGTIFNITFKIPE